MPNLIRKKTLKALQENPKRARKILKEGFSNKKESKYLTATEAYRLATSLEERKNEELWKLMFERIRTAALAGHTCLRFVTKAPYLGKRDFKDVWWMAQRMSG